MPLSTPVYRLFRSPTSWCLPALIKGYIFDSFFLGGLEDLGLLQTFRQSGAHQFLSASVEVFFVFLDQCLQLGH